MSTEKYAELNKAVAATGNADIIDVEIFTGDDIVFLLLKRWHQTMPTDRSSPCLWLDLEVSAVLPARHLVPV